MTVCIAAVCNNIAGGGAKIVLCTDGKASGPVGSKEYAQKSYLLTRRWHCLTSGGDNDLNALLPRLRARLRACSPIDETTIQTVLRLALGDLKLERCNEYTRGHYGMAYADFLRDGKGVFPEDQFRADVFAISNIVPNVECIVAGFTDDGFPMLLLVYGNGSVHIKEEFVVAGEGGYLAEAALLQRQHNDVASLERTLYCVYEAKRHAQRVASVNDVTNMSVLSVEGFDVVRAAGREYLESIFEKCAPQPIPGSIVIEHKFMRRIESSSEIVMGPKAG